MGEEVEAMDVTICFLKAKVDPLLWTASQRYLPTSEVANIEKRSIKNWMGLYQPDAPSKLVELLDTQVWGSVKGGSCGSDFLEMTETKPFRFPDKSPWWYLMVLVRFLGNLGDGHPPLIRKFFSWVFLNPYGIGLMSCKQMNISSVQTNFGWSRQPIIDLTLVLLSHTSKQHLIR